MLLQGAAALSATRAFAQNVDRGTWPDRPVRLIVPYPAGGSTDILARILADQLKEILGQPFVVENRPGAGGNLGISALVSSPPDGYTIGAATIGQFSINQYLYDRMPYDPERDIVPVSMTWELPNVAVVASQHVPAQTLAEFIAWAKARPDGITYGSPGVGTTPHLSAALFVNRAGLTGAHVPFRGAAQTIPAMLSGDVTFALDNLASYISFIEAGNMRALAVTSSQRWPTLPNVPTMAEAGMPRPVIDRLSGAMQQVVKEPALQKRFEVAGARALSSTPEEAAALAARERAVWKDVVRISGAKAH
jgi:tripartite-type tricarboxylate transporter receptor subunit TctC